MNPIFTKGYVANKAISPYQIVAMTANGEAAPAVGAADKLIGVTGLVGADEGGVADVHRLGISGVRLGGAVAVGDEITSDSNGFGIKLNSNGQTIGSAEQAGVAGDIINVFLRSLPAVSTTV
ncbi:MAG: hypothetical protein FWE57_04340 [Chitinispirillia bacterium]|nr:hypothetical protein [Chitinispirillia bacterium]